MESISIFHDNYTDEEELALENFRSLLTKHLDIIPIELIGDKDKLLRFLRARKLDKDKSYIMLTNYIKWSKEYDIENIYNNFELETEDELTLQLTHNFHKTTKDGMPVLLQVMGDISAESLFATASHEQIIKHTIKLYERMERECFPIISKIHKKYIHSLFGIIDLRKLSIKFVNPRILKTLQGIMAISQDYYPECLGANYIINCGMIFKGLFTMCTPFLDQKTRDKIHLFGNQYSEALLERIDEDSLPACLGGKCNCKEGCLFSGAGPWKKQENKPVKEEILKKRMEIMDDILNYSKTNEQEDK